MGVAPLSQRRCSSPAGGLIRDHTALCRFLHQLCCSILMLMSEYQIKYFGRNLNKRSEMEKENIHHSLSIVSNVKIVCSQNHVIVT